MVRLDKEALFEEGVSYMFSGEINAIKSGSSVCSFEGVGRRFHVRGFKVGVY